jgi:hypothetical protein
MSVVDLALPIGLCAIALFFASFLSWMVLQLHEKDWKKMPREAEFMDALRPFALPNGDYMFPKTDSNKEMTSPEFQKKYQEGPRGILQVRPVANMGQMLGLTLVYFLVVAFVLGYLGTQALKPGDEFLKVVQFFFPAALLAFLAAMVQHSIWFRNRIVGHMIESVFYAAIVSVLFAVLWPK